MSTIRDQESLAHDAVTRSPSIEELHATRDRSSSESSFEVIDRDSSLVDLVESFSEVKFQGIESNLAEVLSDAPELSSGIPPMDDPPASGTFRLPLETDMSAIVIRAQLGLINGVQGTPLNPRVVLLEVHFGKHVWHIMKSRNQLQELDRAMRRCTKRPQYIHSLPGNRLFKSAHHEHVAQRHASLELIFKEYLDLGTLSHPPAGALSSDGREELSEFLQSNVVRCPEAHTMEGYLFKYVSATVLERFYAVLSDSVLYLFGDLNSSPELEYLIVGSKLQARPNPSSHVERLKFVIRTSEGRNIKLFADSEYRANLWATHVLRAGNTSAHQSDECVAPQPARFDFSDMREVVKGSVTT